MIMTSIMDKRMRREVWQRKLIAAILLAGLTVMFTGSVAYGAFFDNAGKSARAMGMGEVFLASSTDATSYWYNPAGLAHFTSRQVGIGYGKPAAFISDLIMTSQINFVTPIGDGNGLGLGFAYEGISEASNMVVSGAYGTSFGSNLTVGANLKLLYWSAQGEDNEWGAGSDDDLSKTSFSLDASAVYDFGAAMGLESMAAGVYVRDAIMPNISKSGDDGGKIPVEAGLGLMGKKNDVTVGADVGFADGNSIFRFGGETPLSGSNLLIRAGYVFESDFEDELEQSDLDLGLGYSFGSLLFDYAYTLPFAQNETNGRHYVSFGFSF